MTATPVSHTPSQDAAAVVAEYKRYRSERQERLAARIQAHARFSYLRLFLVAVGVATLIAGGLNALPWLLIPLFLFVVTAILHAQALNARDRAASAVAFFDRGLARMAHDWIGRGRTGDEFKPEGHLYADDLDIFGRGSVFELLATTRTRAGEATLAAWLLAPAPVEEIRSRQVAVRELAERLDLRETVAVLGDQLRVGVDAALLRRWAASPLTLHGLGVRLALVLLVLATIGSLAWWARTGVGALAMAVLFVQLGAAQWFKQRVVAVIDAVDEPAHDLDLLVGLLRTIEREHFTAPRLVALQEAIGRDGHRASAEIGRLSQLVAVLASRRNVLFAFPAALLLWATQWSFAIEAWRARAGAHIPQWLEAVGEFEAMLALGTLAAEHPDYVFPELTPGATSLVADGLAHPLLPPDAVRNSLRLTRSAIHLAIVSGSNMSGKSTFLRSIGVNVVLAQMGAPVRAVALQLSPLHVGAAIRVQDSLADGQSRFFAEIMRLKQVVDLTRRTNGAVLFLLDEILSGTNSHDRRVGAQAVLIGLVQLGAVGLVTTHDLALGEIAQQLPGAATNVHFDDSFEGGVLRFDYQLKPGVVHTSNALELMRSIGLEI
ncbi:MAG: DNA mismatch repair protein MutS [Vicinamibacterales bacterium]